MTARVLVVDDIQANVKLLEARLSAEYFEVLTASSGQEAVDICEREHVDVVLLDVMMPGMDGYEACRRIKAMPNSHDVPIVMVTALDQSSDRVQGLQAGADDFLTKPVDDIALITRVKNLARVKLLNDELKMRATTTQQLGFLKNGEFAKSLRGENGRILLVDDNVRTAARMLEMLNRTHDAFIERDPARAYQRVSEHKFDLLIVSLGLRNSDGLRLCGQVRSHEKTRHLPIIILLDPGEEARLLRGLDMGVNDYLIRPIDRNEVLARVKTQIRRKRHADFLRVRLEESVEQAITDPLTGLHNRRYMEGHLQTLLEEAIGMQKPLTVLVADIDHFKNINDTYGHDVGDLVLKEFAARLRRNTRSIDLACRLGGEEFIIIMPDTDVDRAWQVAERLRLGIASEPFCVGGGKQIPVTASVGLSKVENHRDTSATLFKRADNALYTAKREGRNRVVIEAA
ncbi:MAG: hypothetical protein RLZ98_123 [Pseudomonadota bacterium]|jgi:two-component system cell cycle response regulator